jgi:hypothetical protein
MFHVSIRDKAEAVIRAWNAYEVGRGSSPIIDFDCFPADADAEPAENRLAVYRDLTDLRPDADGLLASRIDADLAYLGALLGEQRPLTDYIRATQGCGAAGWPDQYVTERGEQARRSLDGLGIGWGPDTAKQLEQAEEPIAPDEAPDAIRQAAEQYEAAVREATGTDAPYTLTIETADVDAYWAYWLDGAGDQVRLRLNQRNSRFTKISARQFALHEVLGHGLQSASLTAQAAAGEVPWVRLLSVHAPHQVMLEGLAQAMPLFIASDDEILTARVRLDHYAQLVRGELHLAVNAGASIDDCVRHAKARIPWWTDAAIADFLTDRGADPLLRSYLWAYPAGIDWFASLAQTDAKVIREVLHAAYRAPLTPADLAELWPAGPPIGGPGGPVRLRQPPVP